MFSRIIPDILDISVDTYPGYRLKKIKMSVESLQHPQLQRPHPFVPIVRATSESLPVKEMRLTVISNLNQGLITPVY